MATTFETRRVKEALDLQISAIKTHAARLSSQDVDELESEYLALEQAVNDLRGILAGLPHAHLEQRRPSGALPASPATSRPEREAKGAETADVTQRRGE